MMNKKEEIRRLLDFGDTDTSTGFISVGVNEIDYTERNIKFIKDFCDVVLEDDKKEEYNVTIGRKSNFQKSPEGTICLSYHYDKELWWSDRIVSCKNIYQSNDVVEYYKRGFVPLYIEVSIIPNSITPKHKAWIKVLYKIPWNPKTDMRIKFKSVWQDVPVNDKEMWDVDKSASGCHFPRGIMYGNVPLIRSCYRKIAWYLKTLGQGL